jgi:hypothetical protein
VSYQIDDMCLGKGSLDPRMAVIWDGASSQSLNTLCVEARKRPLHRKLFMLG